MHGAVSQDSRVPVLIQEDHRNATEGYMLGEPTRTALSETVLDGLSPGEIYRWCVGEYGRCSGKVFVDAEDGRRLHVGWVFVKRDRYEDTGETFLHETWVTLLVRHELVREVDYFGISS